MGKNLSRRDFLKGTAAGAASLAAMGMLGGCSQPAAAGGEGGGAATRGLAVYHGRSEQRHRLLAPGLCRL